MSSLQREVAAATTAAIADRARYEGFLRAAEDYAVRHGLIVGGETATRLLLRGRDDPPELDSFSYTFYSSSAVRDARGLADAMYAVAPQGLGRYTAMFTRMAGHRFDIEVDGRVLLRVILLPPHKNVQTIDVVIPSKRPAQFGGQDLLCMGPELRLIETYGQLCAPGEAGSWEQLMADEQRLRAVFMAEIRAKIATAVARQQATGGAYQQPLRQRLLAALLRDFVPGEGRVLIGAAAIQLTAGELPTWTGRLQVVSGRPFAEETRIIADIAQAVGARVHYGTEDPKIPVLTRLRRITVHFVENGVRSLSQEERREAVLDVYNLGSFELVPWVALGTLRGDDDDGGGGGGEEAPAVAAPSPPAAAEGGAAGPARRGRPTASAAAVWPELPPSVKVGTPYVLMRMLLVDMWTIQVIMRLKALSAQGGQQILHGQLRDFTRAAAEYDRHLRAVAADASGRAAAAAATRLLGARPDGAPSAFIGQGVDAALALRREQAGPARPSPGAAAQPTQGHAAPPQRFHPLYLPAQAANAAVTAPLPS